jgi:hypothetical protein
VSTVRAGDAELWVEERGDRAPLLLIAGLPAVASDWEPLAAPLGARRRAIGYDNRGSGVSTVTPGPYTIAQRSAGLGASAGSSLAARMPASATRRADRARRRGRSRSRPTTGRCGDSASLTPSCTSWRAPAPLFVERAEETERVLETFLTGGAPPPEARRTT